MDISLEFLHGIPTPYLMGLFPGKPSWNSRLRMVTFLSCGHGPRLKESVLENGGVFMGGYVFGQQVLYRVIEDVFGQSIT